MVIPLIIYGSPVLREKSFDIEGPEEITSLAANLKETLKNAGGLGLAASQTGILKNIFIINTGPLDSAEDEKVEKAYINPEILNFGDYNVYFQEGCLSIPDIFEDVYRPDKVEVCYRDEQFNWQEEVLDGLVARIFQHEYDHLEGILFTDRLSAIRKKLIKVKLNKLKRKTLKKA